MASRVARRRAAVRGHTHEVIGPKALQRDEFFAIMGAFVAGVTVVTALDPASRPRGLTVSAVCSVSADPPLMLACIDKKSNTLPAIRHSGRFAVNYLAFGHEDVARLFASKDPDKFDAVAWRPAGNQMPWLHTVTLALAECTVVEEIDAGDHVVVIGRVEGGRPPDVGSRPLVYFRRGYTTA